VAAAEEEHARLGTEAWGAPGYSLGTYHPANLKAASGWALVSVGLHNEAKPRLDEAAALLNGTKSGLLTVVWISQAHAAIGTGDTDGAHTHAAMAVAEAETHPAAWVAKTVTRLSARAGGAFGELVERTARWGFA
jgi:hypothetical protein